MDYQENVLCYEDYDRLRESVGWTHFSREQTQAALNNSFYTVTCFEDGQTVGMGRLIGDGVYLMIADVVVSPAYQQKGIGSKIVKMLTDYADRQLPVGGRACIQLIAEKGKEPFYEKMGFQLIPNEHCGSGMQIIIRNKADYSHLHSQHHLPYQI